MDPKLLFIPILAFCSMANSQSVIDEGNTWINWWVNWDLQTSGQYQLKIEGDTLINGFSYKTLIQNNDLSNPVWYRLPVYLREDSDKRVYILDSTLHEGLLYDFSLDVGDQVDLWNGFTATVKSIDSIPVAHNQMRKRLSIRANRIEPQGYGVGANWIEGIGDRDKLIYDYSPDISNALACFFREDELYYPEDPDYCLGLVSSAAEIQEPTIDIFPNPVTDMLSIRFDHELNQLKSIRLYSLEGKLLFQSDTQDVMLQIDMSRMASSMYILQIMTSENYLVSRKIVKR